MRKGCIGGGFQLHQGRRPAMEQWKQSELSSRYNANASPRVYLPKQLPPEDEEVTLEKVIGCRSTVLSARPDLTHRFSAVSHVLRHAEQRPQPLKQLPVGCPMARWTKTSEAPNQPSQPSPTPRRSRMQDPSPRQPPRQTFVQEPSSRAPSLSSFPHADENVQVEVREKPLPGCYAPPPTRDIAAVQPSLPVQSESGREFGPRRNPSTPSGFMDAAFPMHANTFTEIHAVHDELIAEKRLVMPELTGALLWRIGGGGGGSRIDYAALGSSVIGSARRHQQH
jgi:hypothetical protein